MKALYKYEVTPEGRTVMPTGAEILSVGTQDDRIVVWAIVDIDALNVRRRLVGVPTGSKFEDIIAPKRDQFLGTAQLPGGLVFHIFDRGEMDP